MVCLSLDLASHGNVKACAIQMSVQQPSDCILMSGALWNSKRSPLAQKGNVHVFNNTLTSWSEQVTYILQYVVPQLYHGGQFRTYRPGYMCDKHYDFSCLSWQILRMLEAPSLAQQA